MKSQQVWVDAGYMTTVVQALCRESGQTYRRALGRGAAQQ